MAAASWYIIPGKSLLARWFNILHWPLTLWHLSYVVIGASLAQEVSWPLLGWMLLAFALGMGVAAHCVDLLQGDPLRLGLSRRALYLVGALALVAAMGIGIWQVWAGNVPQEMLLAVPVGAILAFGYGSEWTKLHGDWQFAAWWAVFPLLVGYWSQGLDLHPALVPLAVFAFCSAYAQRTLSTRARFLRRKVEDVSIMTDFAHCLEVDGEAVGKAWMLHPLDKALIWLNATMVALAVGMVLWRL